MTNRRQKNRDEGRAGDGCVPGSRRATERAILVLSGERGYGGFTIAELLARSGSNRARFYSTWTGKEDCYFSAHASASEQLSRRLLEAAAAGRTWEDGVADALVELEVFVEAAPDLAAGLIGGAHVAGGLALEKRAEIFARLAQALDRGREGMAPSVAPPSPATPTLILNAIEAAVLRVVDEGGSLRENLPGLLFLILVYYRGATDARRAAARFGAGPQA